MKPTRPIARVVRTLASVAAAALLAAGCAPLVVGGAMVGGALVASDRRSVGIQLEDEAIEARIDRVLAARYGSSAINVNVVSYNRRVLLVGQVPDADIKADIFQTADRTENVRLVMNELQVGALATRADRNNDSVISGRVRAALLEARDVPSGATRATTERGIVYLMGRVTEAEGAAIARLTARVQGVQQVVKMFDILTEAELESMRTHTSPPASPRKP